MKKILKKVTSLIVTISVVFAALGTLPVSAASEVGTVGDGWDISSSVRPDLIALVRLLIR